MNTIKQTFSGEEMVADVKRLNRLLWFAENRSLCRRGA